LPLPSPPGARSMFSCPIVSLPAEAREAVRLPADRPF
jgi:hypothetical protein